MQINYFDCLTNQKEPLLKNIYISYLYFFENLVTFYFIQIIISIKKITVNNIKIH